MVPNVARRYDPGMPNYDACFIGDGRDPEMMVHFEASDDDTAIKHADHQWESGTWTTTASSFRLRNVETDSWIHSRDRRNAKGS